MKPDLNRKEVFERAIGSIKTPEACTTEVSWHKLNARIERSADAPVVRLNRKKNPALFAAAAILLLALGAMFWYGSVRSATGAFFAESTVFVDLPDGTVVMLLTGSEMNYRINAKSRDVSLRGEAFFDVAKGSPFRVQTQGADIEVLGTSFNVFSEGESFAVECITGKVEVRCASDVALLGAGQAVKRRQGVLCAPFEHGVTRGNNELNDERSYTNADLARVFRHVEQRFDVKVRVKGDISGKEFSGSFTMNDAETSLTLITRAMGLELLSVSEGVFDVMAR